MEFYELEEESLFDENIGNYISYGIRMADGSTIADISTDRDAVSTLIHMMNEYRLDKIHVQEVIDDFLGESLAVQDTSDNTISRSVEYHFVPEDSMLFWRRGKRAFF